MAPKKQTPSKAATTSRKLSPGREPSIPSRDQDTGISKSVISSAKALSRASGQESEDVSHPPTFDIPFEGKSITAQRFSLSSSTQSDSAPALIFTHGAGGGIANPATSLFAKGFARQADIVLYQGTMNLPNRVKAFHAVIDFSGGDEASLGGRSMGARAAVLAAKEHATKTLILASYPLVGQNGEVRDQILLDIDVSIDVLFISGDQDHMCKIEQLQKVREKMKAKSWLAVVEGADHGMSIKPKGAVEPIREYTGELAAKWLQRRDAERTALALSWRATDKKVNDPGWKATGMQKVNSIKDAFAKAGAKSKMLRESEEGPAKKRRKVNEK